MEEDTNPYSLQQTLPASLAHMNLCRLDSRVTDLITVRQKEMVEGGRFFFHLFFLVFFVFFFIRVEETVQGPKYWKESHAYSLNSNVYALKWHNTLFFAGNH